MPGKTNRERRNTAIFYHSRTSDCVKPLHALSIASPSLSKSTILSAEFDPLGTDLQSMRVVSMWFMSSWVLSPASASNCYVRDVGDGVMYIIIALCIYTCFTECLTFIRHIYRLLSLGSFHSNQSIGRV